MLYKSRGGWGGSEKGACGKHLNSNLEICWGAICTSKNQDRPTIRYLENERSGVFLYMFMFFYTVSYIAKMLHQALDEASRERESQQLRERDQQEDVAVVPLLGVKKATGPLTSLC